MKSTISTIVLLMLATGCAKPGLRGVSPWRSELNKADQEITSRKLSPSRNLPRVALDRVVMKIKGAARDTCLAVGGSNCGDIGHPVGILNDPAINAFVDGQHKISVYSGLLTHASSDGEIAAVLAHEYGHIFARHIEKRQQNAGLGVLAGALAGIVVASTTGVDVIKESIETGHEVGALAYSQDSELEADYYATLILENAGIDLHYGLNLMIRLARSSRSHPGSGTWDEKAQLMAATHPANDFRIARWLSVSNSIKAGQYLNGDHQLRQDAQDRLLGNLGEDMVRWVNPRNGHSGTLLFKDAKYEKACERSCIQIEQVDSIQEQQTKTWHWLCKAEGKWWPQDVVTCEEERP